VVGWGDSVVPGLVFQVVERLCEELALLVVADSGRTEMVKLELGFRQGSGMGCGYKDAIDHVVAGDCAIEHIRIRKVSR